MVKEYLSQRSISFREVDVSRDVAGAQEMVSLSEQRGVPVTVVDGQVVVGFDRERLDAILSSTGRPKLGAAVADADRIVGKGLAENQAGAYIGRVSPGSPAEQAGLRAGDVIVRIANRQITSARDLEETIVKLPRGRDIPVTYVRDGAQEITSIRL